VHCSEEEESCSETASEYATMIVPDEEDDDLIDETVNGLMTVKDRCATDNEILSDNGYL
jgi:hypothetical protein